MDLQQSTVRLSIDGAVLRQRWWFSSFGARDINRIVRLRTSTGPVPASQVDVGSRSNTGNSSEARAAAFDVSVHDRYGPTTLRLRVKPTWRPHPTRAGAHPGLPNRRSTRDLPVCISETPPASVESAKPEAPKGSKWRSHRANGDFAHSTHLHDCGLTDMIEPADAWIADTATPQPRELPPAFPIRAAWVVGQCLREEPEVVRGRSRVLEHWEKRHG